MVVVVAVKAACVSVLAPLPWLVLGPGLAECYIIMEFPPPAPAAPEFQGHRFPLHRDAAPRPRQHQGFSDRARVAGTSPAPLSGTLVIQQTNLGPLLGRLLGPLLGLAATFVTTHFRFHDAATAARC